MPKLKVMVEVNVDLSDEDMASDRFDDAMSLIGDTLENEIDFVTDAEVTDWNTEKGE